MPGKLVNASKRKAGIKKRLPIYIYFLPPESLMLQEKAVNSSKCEPVFKKLRKTQPKLQSVLF